MLQQFTKGISSVIPPEVLFWIVLWLKFRDSSREILLSASSDVPPRTFSGISARIVPGTTSRTSSEIPLETFFPNSFRNCFRDLLMNCCPNSLDHAEGYDGWYSWSVRILSVKEISLNCLGIEYLRTWHTICTYKLVVGRGYSQLITEEVFEDY